MSTATLLKQSMFYDVLFPKPIETVATGVQDLSFRRTITYNPSPYLVLEDCDLVLFDLETTGLDSDNHLIIEIGAIRYRRGEVLSEFSTLVSIDHPLPEEIVNITGITDAMLAGQPAVEPVLRDFFRFVDKAILFAHNAAFDVSFIKAAANRLNIDWYWPTYCTLKMARELLPDLERKNLDTLAQHYGLVFEARHRSIGDVKVTFGVMQEMLAQEGQHLVSLQDFAPFKV